MQLGRVLGTATSTLKHPTFQGERLLYHYIDIIETVNFFGFFRYYIRDYVRGIAYVKFLYDFFVFFVFVCAFFFILPVFFALSGFFMHLGFGHSPFFLFFRFHLF